MRAPRYRHSLHLVLPSCGDLNVVVVVVVVVVVIVVVVVVLGAHYRCKYMPQQLASGACKCTDSRRRVVAATANPSPQDAACPAEKSARSRSADIKETSYETRSFEMTFTRDDSPTFMNVNLILSL